MTTEEFEAEYQEYTANLDEAIKEAESINAQGVGDDFVIPVSRTWSNEDYTLQLRSKTPVVPAMLNSTLSYAPCPHCGKFMRPKISGAQRGFYPYFVTVHSIELSCSTCGQYTLSIETNIAQSINGIYESIQHLVEHAKDQYNKNHQ